jgi:hypothetical protein
VKTADREDKAIVVMLAAPEGAEDILPIAEPMVARKEKVRNLKATYDRCEGAQYHGEYTGFMMPRASDGYRYLRLSTTLQQQTSGQI